MIVELGPHSYDVAFRAVVVGLVAASGASRGELVESARSLVGMGAAAVELLGGEKGWAGSIDALRRALGCPVGCAVSSPAHLGQAAVAGADFVSLDDAGAVEALAERLRPLSAAGASGPTASPEPAGWAPSLIATPRSLDALAAALPAGLLAPSRLVADAAPGGGGRTLELLASQVERSDTWVLGATLGGDLERDVAAGATVAVDLGARVLRTPAVRSARRAADIVATLLTERAGVPVRGGS